MTFVPDEGYFFGMGAFETIAVENGKPIFLKEHFERLGRALDFLGYDFPETEIEKQIQHNLGKPQMKEGRKALKICVSQKNVLVLPRENTYGEEIVSKGFHTDLCSTRRNETSPFVYHKTFQYGDCIREKRLAKERGIHEPVFLNTKGMIAEGAVSNVFFVKNGQIYTPKVSCGLLPGIIRRYVMRTCPVTEREVYPYEVMECDEMFLTNSLMGIMPVVSFEGYRFPSRETADRLAAEYRAFIFSVTVKNRL